MHRLGQTTAPSGNTSTAAAASKASLLPRVHCRARQNPSNHTPLLASGSSQPRLLLAHHTTPQHRPRQNRQPQSNCLAPRPGQQASPPACSTPGHSLRTCTATSHAHGSQRSQLLVPGGVVACMKWRVRHEQAHERREQRAAPRDDERPQQPVVVDLDQDEDEDGQVHG